MLFFCGAEGATRKPSSWGRAKPAPRMTALLLSVVGTQVKLRVAIIKDIMMKDLEPAYQTLRFVGKVLIGLSIIALLVMVYRIIKHYDYNLSLSIIALIAGLFLWRERVKASHRIAWIAGFFIAVGLGGLIAYFVFMPGDLVLAFMRVRPLVVVGNLISPLLVCCVAIWVLYRLTRPAIKALWEHNKINFKGYLSKPSMGFNVGFGVVAATLIIGYNLQHSPQYTALTNIAITQAKAKVAQDYQFWVADIDQKTEQSLSSGSAVVYAYRKNEIKTLTVTWKNQAVVIKKDK